ncbi:hypothetical protein [Alicyclobacillus sp. SP_1]|uniref:hypothetical protein n=1 Tax=Alicyclobacillus sp. SP_1 TaxID=2942475 RepID=UPI00215755FB|nr:hypothetical protein [Alicyclobacillus sp. SP_1]
MEEIGRMLVKGPGKLAVVKRIALGAETTRAIFGNDLYRGLPDPSDSALSNVVLCYDKTAAQKGESFNFHVQNASDVYGVAFFVAITPDGVVGSLSNEQIEEICNYYGIQRRRTSHSQKSATRPRSYDPSYDPDKGELRYIFGIPMEVHDYVPQQMKALDDAFNEVLTKHGLSLEDLKD